MFKTKVGLCFSQTITLTHLSVCQWQSLFCLQNFPIGFWFTMAFAENIQSRHFFLLARQICYISVMEERIAIMFKAKVELCFSKTIPLTHLSVSVTVPVCFQNFPMVCNYTWNYICLNYSEQTFLLGRQICHISVRKTCLWRNAIMFKTKLYRTVFVCKTITLTYFLVYQWPSLFVFKTSRSVWYI